MKTAETALPNSLSPEELSVIGEAATCYKRLIKVPCTGCSYCMPCPNGVNIPANFNVYNYRNLFNQKIYSIGMYAITVMGVLDGNKSDASLCKDCGLCAKKCPQHIAIPQELKAVNRQLGGTQTKLMMPFIKRLAKKQFKNKLD